MPEPAAVPPPLGALQCRGLVHEAGGRRLLDGLDLDLPARGISVIMGVNGAGKSLALRMIHGLAQPQAGSIAFCGGPAPRQAMVFQRPVLLRRSARANVDYVLKGSRAERRRRCEALLERVGLGALARQPARLLSGGEQQRLALARALGTNPQMLLLDEATASLDPLSVRMIEQIVRDFAGSGGKVVIVTHDVAQARRLADDVAFLHRGRLCEYGAASEFFENPRSREAKSFLAGEILT
jgi:tungstate transport system ATP-binding protein